MSSCRPMEPHRLHRTLDQLAINIYEVLCYIHEILGTTTPLTRSGVAIQMAWLNDRSLAVLWDNDNPWTRLRSMSTKTSIPANGAGH